MRKEPRKLTLSTKIPFGKYKGISVWDILHEKHDVNYIEWLLPKWEGEICEKIKYSLKELK